MYRNNYIPQTPFPHNRDYSYDQLADTAAFALRTIGKLSSAASENSDLKRELEESTATVRRHETEIANLKAQLARLDRQETDIVDLKAQLVRVATDRRATDLADFDAHLTRLGNVVVRSEQLKAEYENLETLFAAIVASSDRVIFVPQAEQQHECAVCFEEVCNLRIKFSCNCVNRVCPQCFHQSDQVCLICRAGPE
jgi:septal ring factor EnvC (AmiA/AmiB activator)